MSLKTALNHSTLAIGLALAGLIVGMAPVQAQIATMPAGIQQASPLQSGPPRPDPLIALEAGMAATPKGNETSSPAILAVEDPATLSGQALLESKLPQEAKSAIQNIFSSIVTPMGSEVESDYGWMISLADRPNGITIPETDVLPALMIDIPSGQDIQLKFPGQSLEQAEVVRLQVLRYFEVVVKGASDIRSRQQAQLESWLQYVGGLHGKVSIDPWHRWYFGILTQEHLRPAYAKLLQQSKSADAQVLSMAQGYVEKITPLLTQAPTQEARMAWYGVLLQFRQGLGVYRDQVQQGDRKVLGLVEAYMQKYPAAPRPAGPKPTKPNTTPAAMPPFAADKGGVTLPPVEARPAAVSLKDTSSSSSILVAIVMILIVVGYGYLKLRQRVKNKPGV